MCRANSRQFEPAQMTYYQKYPIISGMPVEGTGLLCMGHFVPDQIRII